MRWTYNSLLIAEEKGITKANIEEVAGSSTDPEIRRLLGLEGEMGKMFGLDNDWAKRAIAANGNYGEIFEANLGTGTPIGLARGLNALWTQGGLQYAWPMRLICPGGASERRAPSSLRSNTQNNHDHGLPDCGSTITGKSRRRSGSGGIHGLCHQSGGGVEGRLSPFDADL